MVNKIATVMMVKNEEDIIESSIRHACKISDEVYVCDHMSIDKTREILESLKSEGLPVRISTHSSSRQEQVEVLNQLTNQAIENGADIVIPLDADEFIIMTGGKNSEDLRKFLQTLDLDKIYRLVWISCLFVEPDKDLDKYALARPSLRSVGSSVFDPNPKLIAGVGALKKYDLDISVHYCVKKSNGEQFQHHETLENVVNWHYRFRNKNQFISKEMTAFIKRTQTATKYSVWLLLNDSLKKFLAGGEYDVQDIFRLGIVDRPYPADEDLAPYRDEATLRFTGGGGHEYSTQHLHHCYQYCGRKLYTKNSRSQPDRSALHSTRWKFRTHE